MQFCAVLVVVCRDKILRGDAMSCCQLSALVVSAIEASHILCGYKICLERCVVLQHPQVSTECLDIVRLHGGD